MDNINPSPSLASQAPKVSRITVMAALGAEVLSKINGTNNTSLSVIPSKESKVIKKCV